MLARMRTTVDAIAGVFGSLLLAGLFGWAAAGFARSVRPVVLSLLRLFVNETDDRETED